MLTQTIFWVLATLGLFVGLGLAWFLPMKPWVKTLAYWDAELALLALAILVFSSEPNWLYVAIIAIALASSAASVVFKFRKLHR